jgi:hypothetical protein
MPPPSDPRLLVLHGLQLKGNALAPAVADTVDLPVADVERELRTLEAEGLVVQRTSPPSGWGLTPAGRETVSRLVAAEVDAAGARPAVTHAYHRFRALNAAVLDACSRWQVRDVAGEAVRNDHRNASYDAAVVADLARLQRRAAPVVDDLAGTLARYRAYGPRLRRAVEHVEAGDGDWFTKPSLPSYHTVWFELHEDLLTTLGLDRSEESESTDTEATADTEETADTGAAADAGARAGR